MKEDRKIKRKNEHLRVLMSNHQTKEFQKKTKEQISKEVNSSYFYEPKTEAEEI